MELTEREVKDLGKKIVEFLYKEKVPGEVWELINLYDLDLECEKPEKDRYILKIANREFRIEYDFVRNLYVIAEAGKIILEIGRA